MKTGFFKPLALVIAAAAFLPAVPWAITSDDIDATSTRRSSSLEPFYVEIRAEGGKQIEDHDTKVKPHAIPNSRLNHNSSASSGVNSSKASQKDIGFFTYKFPDDYNVNKTADSRPLKPGESLHRLASDTKDISVSVNQQMASIFRKNIKCFTNGRLSGLQKGCIIKLPYPNQAIAEDPALARALYANGGVGIDEYRYAMANCPSGVCGMPSSDKVPTADTTTVATTDKKEQQGLTLDNDKKDPGVTYYQTDKDKEKKQENASAKGTEVAPVSTIYLTDQNGQNLTQEEFMKEHAKPNSNVSGKTSATGSSLSFSGDTVAAQNAKGEVIEEVSKKFDSKFDDINSRFDTSNSDISKLNRELEDLKKQLAAQEQRNSEQLAKIASLLEEKKTEVEAVQSEDGVPLSLVATVATIVLLILLVVSFFTYRMRNKFRKEMASEVDDDELDQTGDFDHLMSLDPIAMVPTGSNEAEGSADAKDQATPTSTTGIDLNVASDEKPNSKESPSFFVADDSLSEDLTLDEDTFQKAEVGATEVVKEDPSLRVQQKVDLQSSDDLVPPDLPGGNEELDESDFLAENDKNSVDLNSNLTTSDIDNIIKNTTEIEPDSPLAQASGTKPNEEASPNDIDAIIASLNEQKKIEQQEIHRAQEDEIRKAQEKVKEQEALNAAKAEEKASADDIDAILASAGKSEEKASADDIDAILASAGKSEEKTSADDIDDILASVGKSDEKSSADDIDAILAQAGKGEEKASADDIDAIPAQAGKGDEKASADDIDAILAQAGKGEEKASTDDIDDILASVGKDEEKASADDIDAILAQAGKGEEKASADDIDAILAQASADTLDPVVKKDEKASADDIDAILASAQDSKKSAKKTTVNDVIASGDDIDAILAEVGSSKKADTKASGQDDIDDIINSISSVSESSPLQPNAVAEQGSTAPVNEIVSNDDIDELLKQGTEEPAMSDEDATDNISLAKAFISIDDKQGARNALLEVLNNASAEFRAQAETMLSKLKS